MPVERFDRTGSRRPLLIHLDPLPRWLMRFPSKIQHLFAAIILIAVVGLVGCTGSPEPGASSYRYEFEEANDTPHALAATLFYALRTEDEALWQRYVVTFDELKAHQKRTRRSPSPDEDIREEVERVRGDFANIRDELRYAQGVHGAERIRFLRAITQYYSAEDSIQQRTGVEYTYQGHYIGGVLFRQMIKTERGWVLSERSRYRDDVERLVPLGLSRR